MEPKNAQILKEKQAQLESIMNLMVKIHTTFIEIWKQIIEKGEGVEGVDADDFELQYLMHTIDWTLPTNDNKRIKLCPPDWKGGNLVQYILEDGLKVDDYCDFFWHSRLGDPEEYLKRLRYLEKKQ